MSHPKLEVACFDFKSALFAIKAKVDRIEYCADLVLGGTTPTIEEVKYLKNHTDIPIYVMIRPRGGDFCYNQEEVDHMKLAITLFKKNKADGFVFGALTNDLAIDLAINSALVNLAEDLPCTFHRAFDRTSDAKLALEQLIQCGFKTVLTSGHAISAIAGIANLQQYKSWANGRIDIMPGGGVRSSNLNELLAINANFYHTSAILPQQEVNDLDEIKACLNILNHAK